MTIYICYFFYFFSTLFHISFFIKNIITACICKNIKIINIIYFSIIIKPIIQFISNTKITI